MNPTLRISYEKKLLKITRHLLSNFAFQSRHKTHEKAFTRNRKLTFAVVMILILQKGMKSLQLRLNEFFTALDLHPVSTSAFSQMRQNLSYTAFVELNQEAVVNPLYEDPQEYQTWRGFRLLGIDGSKIRLPDSASVRDAFGSFRVSNEPGKTLKQYPLAIASVLYDVLNGVALDSQLAHATSYEVDWAKTHLPHTRTQDLLLCDRNYASYLWLATLLQQGCDFAIRCSKSSFGAARQLFLNTGAPSLIVTLTPHDKKRQKSLNLGLPLQIKVRFVRVTLNTGETEVLVSSLLDETLYTPLDFKILYHLRWGVETFYSILKSRLTLENFSGKTAEAVRQDFYSSVFLCGMESILTRDAQRLLDEKTKPDTYDRNVNRMVSFNALKHQAFELLCSNEDLDSILEKLTQLFLNKPIYLQKERDRPRKKLRDEQRIGYHLRKKKICY